MPFAWWAKFDTNESINYWMHLINKPFGLSRGPGMENKPKILHHCCHFQQLFFSGRSCHIQTSSSHVFTQSHAPSFSLLISLCSICGRKKMLTLIHFPLVSPSQWGGHCYNISIELSSSAQLRVGCSPLTLWDAAEQTPLHHLYSHKQLEAELIGTTVVSSLDHCVKTLTWKIKKN